MAIYKVINGAAVLFADISRDNANITPGGKTIQSIAITTPPTNTHFDVGDTLDLTGMVVTATYVDGEGVTSTEDVTADVTINPSIGTTLTRTSASDWKQDVIVTYTEGGAMYDAWQWIYVGNPDCFDIRVTTMPTKTSYTAGETLDLTGLVVTATYGDQTEADVTSNVTTVPADGDTLTVANTKVDITYAYEFQTLTASFNITVSS